MTLEIAIVVGPLPGARAKLLPEWASDMRRRFAAREATSRQLAKEYRLSYEGVRQVLRGRCWKGIV